MPDWTTIAGALVGLIGGYAVLKYRLHSLRVAIDAVDDAVKDDRVTEDEFREVWMAFAGVYRGR